MAFLVALAAADAYADEFVAESYLIPMSVPVSGTAGALPSQLGAPSQFLDFPARAAGPPEVRLEVSSIPLFGGLSNAVAGALSVGLDSLTRVGVAGSMIIDDGIYSRPSLEYTRQERMLDPTKRPVECDCAELTNTDYIATLHAQRTFRGQLPRGDIFAWTVPVRVTAGINLKYLKQELLGEGTPYIAQNLNVDAAIGVSLLAGFDPSSQGPPREILVDVSGFELLPTPYASGLASETVNSRFHLGVYWLEPVYGWHSRFQFGVQQKTEFGNLPGLGLEWNYRDMLFLRGGMHSEYISGGASVQYKFVAFHYALNHHNLDATPYQVSLQIQGPCCRLPWR